jgi:hypothetical protein
MVAHSSEADNPSKITRWGSKYALGAQLLDFRLAETDAAEDFGVLVKGRLSQSGVVG